MPEYKLTPTPSELDARKQLAEALPILLHNLASVMQAETGQYCVYIQDVFDVLHTEAMIYCEPRYVRDTLKEFGWAGGNKYLNGIVKHVWAPVGLWKAPQ